MVDSVRLSRTTNPTTAGLLETAGLIETAGLLETAGLIETAGF